MTDRLETLLPWINGDDLPLTEVRAALRRFLFQDGVETTDRVVTGGGVRFELADMTAQQAGKLRQEVGSALDALASDFRPRPSLPDGYGYALRSLRLDVYRLARPRPAKLTPESRRRLLLSPGCVLRVDGTLRDVLLFQVLRLMTAPGVLALDRCPAPAIGAPAKPCDRWFVAVGGGRGPTRRFCRYACRVRWSQAHPPRRPGSTSKRGRHIVRRRKTA